MISMHVRSTYIHVLHFEFQFLPVAAIINRSVLKHRWTTLFGMLLIFIGLLLDAMTLGRGVLYASHLLFMGIGGSLAYGSAMSVCWYDRFNSSNRWIHHLVHTILTVTDSGKKCLSQCL